MALNSNTHPTMPAGEPQGDGPLESTSDFGSFEVVDEKAEIPLTPANDEIAEEFPEGGMEGANPELLALVDRMPPNMKGLSVLERWEVENGLRKPPAAQAPAAPAAAAQPTGEQAPVAQATESAPVEPAAPTVPATPAFDFASMWKVPEDVNPSLLPQEQQAVVSHVQQVYARHAAVERQVAAKQALAVDEAARAFDALNTQLKESGGTDLDALKQFIVERTSYYAIAADLNAQYEARLFEKDNPDYAHANDTQREMMQKFASMDEQQLLSMFPSAKDDGDIVGAMSRAWAYVKYQTGGVRQPQQARPQPVVAPTITQVAPAATPKKPVTGEGVIGQGGVRPVAPVAHSLADKMRMAEEQLQRNWFGRTGG